MGAQNAKSDMERYRSGYPGEEDNPRESENLRFYKGQRPSIPDGDLIDNIHTSWWGKYALLERHHGYIQWLFPIREHGMNHESQKLQPHEITAMKADPQCLARLIKSYRLILDFYGIVLKDETTGALERNPDNWKQRYANLNSSSHNYLRITRILKCLGEFGFEHMKAPFIEFFIEEIYANRQLRNCRTSMANYWLGTLRDDAERGRLEKVIAENDEKEAGGASASSAHRVPPYSGAARRATQMDSSSDDDGDGSSADEKVDTKPKAVVGTVANPHVGTAAAGAVAVAMGNAGTPPPGVNDSTTTVAGQVAQQQQQGDDLPALVAEKDAP